MAFPHPLVARQTCGHSWVRHGEKKIEKEIRQAVKLKTKAQTCNVFFHFLPCEYATSPVFSITTEMESSGEEDLDHGGQWYEEDENEEEDDDDDEDADDDTRSVVGLLREHYELGYSLTMKIMEMPRIANVLLKYQVGSVDGDGSDGEKELLPVSIYADDMRIRMTMDVPLTPEQCLAYSVPVEQSLIFIEVIFFREQCKEMTVKVKCTVSNGSPDLPGLLIMAKTLEAHLGLLSLLFFEPGGIGKPVIEEQAGAVVDRLGRLLNTRRFGIPYAEDYDVGAPVSIFSSLLPADKEVLAQGNGEDARRFLLRHLFFGEKLGPTTKETLSEQCVDEHETDAYYLPKRKAADFEEPCSLVPTMVTTPSILLKRNTMKFTEEVCQGHCPVVAAEAVNEPPKNQILFKNRNKDHSLYRQEAKHYAALIGNTSIHEYDLFMRLLRLAVRYSYTFCPICGVPRDPKVVLSQACALSCSQSVCALSLRRMHVSFLALQMLYDKEASGLLLVHAYEYHLYAGDSAKAYRLLDIMSRFKTIEELAMGTSILQEEDRSVLSSVFSACVLRHTDTVVQGWGQPLEGCHAFEVVTTHAQHLARDFQQELEKTCYVKGAEEYSNDYRAFADVVFHGTRHYNAFSVLARGTKNYSGSARQAVGRSYGDGVYCGALDTALGYATPNTYPSQLSTIPLLSSCSMATDILKDSASTLFVLNVVSTHPSILTSETNANMPMHMAVLQCTRMFAPTYARLTHVLFIYDRAKFLQQLARAT
jgi:hypothetical protein